MRLTWETRTAMGYDVHRLEDGEELWLGGVLIPHHQGLSGHSDADVALHALTDALLGRSRRAISGPTSPPAIRSGRVPSRASSCNMPPS